MGLDERLKNNFSKFNVLIDEMKIMEDKRKELTKNVEKKTF